MQLIEMAKKAGQVKADAAQTMEDFDPSWLVSAIAAQLKKFAINALASAPRIEKLAERLGVEREVALVMWNAFLQHLKEDF